MPNLTIVNYHYVRDMQRTPYPSIKGCLVDDFRRQVDYLSRNYNMISMKQYTDYLKGEGEIPENSCILTFDDGLKDHYKNVFPILKEKGISGMFYIITQTLTDLKVPHVHKVHFLLDRLGNQKMADLVNGFLKNRKPELYEKYHIHDKFKVNPKRRFDDIITANLKHNLGTLPYNIKDELLNDIFNQFFDEREFCKELFLSKPEIKEMVDGGMEIGSHGHAHHQPAELSKEDQIEDIKKSTEILKSIIGKVNSFSYPNGSYNQDTIDILKEFAYSTSVTIHLGKNKGIVDPFTIKRNDTNDFPK